jgi:CDGSH-type Zn-finger protein
MSEGPPGGPAVIRIYPDGPLLVRGPVMLLDASGTPIDPRRSTFALCRCGRSALRPFCDGTHARGFRCSGLDRRRLDAGASDDLRD